MDKNYLLYLAAFFVAFGVSLYMTPVCKRISIKLGAIAYPKSRGMHSEPIPQMGGLAIFCGFMAATVILMPIIPEYRTTQFAGFLAGAIIIVVLGMLDDIYILNAKFKLLVQIVVALIAIYSGIVVNTSFLPFQDITKNLSGPLTFIWIIGLINAVNLIDGLDGLAAGVSTICALCLTALCFISGQVSAVVFSAIIAGSCLGFLPRNFNPAEIIMGDTGSTFLGYVLAVSSIMGVYKNYAILSLAIAVLALALPIFDTSFAMIRRILNGKPIMQADRGHLHHRLIDAGFSHKQTVIILYAISAIAGVIAILLAVHDYRAILIVIGALVIFAFMTFVYRKRLD